MKKTVLICCLMAVTSLSFATIRRVGFIDVPAIAGVDYTSFYKAHQAAVDGDTIYVFPRKHFI